MRLDRSFNVLNIESGTQLLKTHPSQFRALPNIGSKTIECLAFVITAIRPKIVYDEWESIFSRAMIRLIYREIYRDMEEKDMNQGGRTK